MTRIREAARLRDVQDMDAALTLIRDVALNDPGNPHAAFGHAQIAFEAWQPAAELFAKAHKLMPDTPDLVRNYALALSAEGDRPAAEGLLESYLTRLPAWLEGHRALADMRHTGGQGDGWDRSYDVATQAEPDNVGIWLAWFHQHAIRKNWQKARTILASAEARFGRTRSIDLSDLFLASESGDADGDLSERFAPYAASGDPGTDLCHVRHLLRTGRAKDAERITARAIQGSAARMFWPYAALCWRLLDDPRLQWLDAGGAHLSSIDLDIPAQELADLAHVLRGLHRLRAPYPEQSVRGGTQTDRNLLLHPDPAIGAIRARFDAAIQRYAQDLPTTVPGHPLLGHRLDKVRFEGSWSVRLSGKGFHAAHTHTHGWLSSAFYVSLPDKPGEAPAGWFTYGSPPPELALPLDAYGRVQPQPGRLVIFPSTLWHGTEPFDEGERLTIAFDVSLSPAAQG